MNPIKWFWNAKQPKGTDWVPYVLVIAIVVVIVAVVVISR